MSTVAAALCATLVDEWRRAGVREAFVAPGSRSTPLVLALENSPLRVHVFHDERAASFAALGNSLSTSIPSVLACTSGTAATHFLAAVAEADLCDIGLIICTADRPPELQAVAAPQTIDQNQLYGSKVRHFDSVVADESLPRNVWRSLGARVFVEAHGNPRPGPVHLNMMFREPLISPTDPTVKSLDEAMISEDGHEYQPKGLSDGRPWHSSTLSKDGHVSSSTSADAIWADIRGLDGVIVAGADTAEPNEVIGLARALRWPIVADHRSGCRVGDEAINHFDSLLRSSTFAEEHLPDVIIRFGRPLASKFLSQWVAASEALVIDAASAGGWINPEHAASVIVADRGLARNLIYAAAQDRDRSDRYLKSWRKADRAAAAAINETLRSLDHLSEPEIARETLASLQPGATLVVASSMPVRHLEWFGSQKANVTVFANRGANGIDGTLSTAIGVALSGTPTTLLIGDIAFLHDSTALINVRQRRINLKVIIVDNDGGGIFSMLPQNEILDSAKFEKLFGTPHNVDIPALCDAHGIGVERWSKVTKPSLTPDGVSVVYASTDRAANAKLLRELQSAVEAALDELG